LDEFKGAWIIKFFRFILILSYIIPISLRVNLDMAKIYYSYCIYKDREMDGTIPRNSTIPEELGRI
jgi:phospholipid-translocating ATPase